MIRTRRDGYRLGPSAGTFEGDGRVAELRRSQGRSGSLAVVVAGARRLRRLRLLDRGRLRRGLAAGGRQRARPPRPPSRSASPTPATSAATRCGSTAATSRPRARSPAARSGSTASTCPTAGTRCRSLARATACSGTPQPLVGVLVDTHAPTLRLAALPTGWVRDRRLRFRAHAEPGARVTAAAHAATAHATAARRASRCRDRLRRDDPARRDRDRRRREPPDRDRQRQGRRHGSRRHVRASRRRALEPRRSSRSTSRTPPDCTRPSGSTASAPRPGRRPGDAALAGTPHAFRHGPRPRRQPHREAAALRRRLDRAPGQRDAAPRRDRKGRERPPEAAPPPGYLHGPPTGV